MTDNETMDLETMVGGVTTTSAMECNGPGCKLWESVLPSPEDSISLLKNQFFTKPSGFKKKKKRGPVEQNLAWGKDPTNRITMPVNLWGEYIYFAWTLSDASGPNK